MLSSGHPSTSQASPPMPPNPRARLLVLSNHLVRPISSSTIPHRNLSSRPDSPPHTPNILVNQGKDFNFPVSPIPANPLGAGKYIKTAAALIIGDEILNGKTLDRNSNYFARYCFEQGIELKRVEVVADNEEEIIEASRRMVRNYDFVITSGGIGPTHDDITYGALAKSFNQNLVHHSETLRRMEEMYKNRPWVAMQNEKQLAATKRMALFPDRAEVLFIAKDVWVPVVRLEGKLCIFPGIPVLFQKLLNGLTPFLPLPPPHLRPLRLQIFTARPESIIAPYLTTLQARLKDEGIRVGSYPVLQEGVYVSLIGSDQQRVREIGREVEKEIMGNIVPDEVVAQKKRAEAGLAADSARAETEQAQKRVSSRS